MAELFLEIFCEEIPARMQVQAGENLSKAMTSGLEKAGLSVEAIQVFTGPRRMVFVADIPSRSPDISEERKGPRVGAPEQALAGFMRGAGLSDISEAQVKSDKKGDYYVAIIEKPGVETAIIVAELVPDVMQNFPWPKSMKSGESSFRWVRPLQSIICLLDGDVVDFEVGGVTSGRETEGHRRHGRGPYAVKNFADYQTVLEGEGHVILSTEARKTLILDSAHEACAAKGLELVEDAGLLNEVAGLAEWPVVILGNMDPSFLELPSEVIRLSMRTHQKYFAVKDPKTGQLAPHFIVVANQVAPDGGKAISEGNSRVLSARLADAQFFQSEDAKRKLIDYYDKLDTVVFHKKLGSIRDKAEKVSRYAFELAEHTGADDSKAKQAGLLAKCDLVTQTVVEFTSLQGQIGRLMYEKEGGDPEIARAIEDHYKPQGPSDRVPTEPISVAVALADKLDTLTGFWAIDEKPTGSKDPYALRRAALGLVRLILDNNVRDLNLIHRLAAYVRAAKPSIGSGVLEAKNLLGFILDRLSVYLRDQGMRHDVIEAVFKQGDDDLVAIVSRVKALQGFLKTESGENLLAGYKRAANILKAESRKGELPTGQAVDPAQAEAAKLYNALQSTSPDIDAKLEIEDFAGAMNALAALRTPIDDFFTHVTVNDTDSDIRDNNLRLLGQIRDIAQQIADFDSIEG